MSNERSTKLRKNVIYMFIIKGLAMITSFLYVPLLLNSLSSDKYAIWLTLTSIVSWISMLDIGLGNGLRNKLSEALAKENFLLAKIYVSTGYGCLSFFVLIILFFFCLFFKCINWVDSILNADLFQSSF